jgi:hypothetical protein
VAQHTTDFHQAQCPDVKLGVNHTGDVIRTWAEADPQQSGGAGGCCTTCAGIEACVGWSYTGEPGQAGGTCSAFSSIRASTWWTRLYIHISPDSLLFSLWSSVRLGYSHGLPL